MSGWQNAQNIDDLRRVAQRRLPKVVCEFVARGSEVEVGLRQNRAALDAIKIKPRVLTDVTGRSTATSILGSEHALPLIAAPTGAAGLLWHRGELELAKAAAAAGIPYTLAMSSITPMEEVRRACDGALWFQLYLSPEREISYGMVERARRAGYNALVLTADTVVSPNREYNARNGFSVPMRINRRNALDLLGHPRWSLGVIGRYLAAGGMPRFENYPEGMRGQVASRQQGRWAPVRRDESADWTEIARLRDVWPGPLIVKGIGCAEDAEAAVQAGVDAIVVSNHGARNLDSALAPIQILPEVVHTVRGRTEIWLDSGLRRGSDLFKALALGAQAVLTGRSALYGLAAGGQAGSGKTFAFFREELDRCMAYAGVTRIDQIGHHNLHVLGLVWPPSSLQHDSLHDTAIPW